MLTDEDWRLYSRCGNDPQIQYELSIRKDRFHDFVNENTVQWARDYCKECPVAQHCLDWALKLQADSSAQQHPRGIWAGTTSKERAHMLTRQVRVRTKAEELLKQMQALSQGK